MLANSLTRTTHLSSGAIAGIVTGVGVALIAITALIVWLVRRQRRRARQALAQSPGVYPEEAYLYDPPINAPPRALPRGPAAAAPSDPFTTSSTSPPPGYDQPEMTDAQAESQGLLGGSTAAATAASSRAASTTRRRPVGAPASQRANPFADPPSQAEQERWPLNPAGGSGTPYSDEPDAGPAARSGASSVPPKPPGGAPTDIAAVAPFADDVRAGGLGGRSVGPHNHDIPGRYGPGGVIRGGDPNVRVRTTVSGPGGGTLGSAGGSPGLRDARRAWGWEG